MGIILGPIFMGVSHTWRLPFMYWNQQTADNYAGHCIRNYRKFSNRRKSRLVAPPRIFRLLVKWKFDLLGKKLIFAIVASLLFATLQIFFLNSHFHIIQLFSADLVRTLQLFFCLFFWIYICCPWKHKNSIPKSFF